MILAGELQLKDRTIEETTPEKIKVSTGFELIPARNKLSAVTNWAP